MPRNLQETVEILRERQAGFALMIEMKLMSEVDLADLDIRCPLNSKVVCSKGCRNFRHSQALTLAVSQLHGFSELAGEEYYDSKIVSNAVPVVLQMMMRDYQILRTQCRPGPIVN